MADFPVGWALRDDLVHQIAFPARNYDDAPQFPDSALLQDEIVAARVRLAGEAADWLALLQTDDHSPRYSVSSAANRLLDNAITFEAVNAIWESVGALSREFPIGEIRRSPELRGVRSIEIN